jgi:hypothetical protein
MPGAYPEGHDIRRANVDWRPAFNEALQSFALAIEGNDGSPDARWEITKRGIQLQNLFLAQVAYAKQLEVKITQDSAAWRAAREDGG